MKSIIGYITLFVLFVPLGLFSQDSPLDSFLETHAEEEGFTYLDLKTNMLSVASDDDEGEMNKVIHVKVLSYEENKGNNTKANDIYEAFCQGFDRKQYIGLMDIKSTEETVEIMVKKDGKTVSEFIIAIKENEGVTLIAASGNFNLNDLGNLKALKNCHSLKVISQMCEE